jgi:hypothetical protein
MCAAFPALCWPRFNMYDPKELMQKAPLRLLNETTNKPPYVGQGGIRAFRNLTTFNDSFSYQVYADYLARVSYTGACCEACMCTCMCMCMCMCTCTCVLMERGWGFLPCLCCWPCRHGVLRVGGSGGVGKKGGGVAWRFLERCVMLLCCVWLCALLPRCERRLDIWTGEWRVLRAVVRLCACGLAWLALYVSAGAVAG